MRDESPHLPIVGSVLGVFGRCRGTGENAPFLLKVEGLSHVLVGVELLGEAGATSGELHHDRDDGAGVLGDEEGGAVA